MTNLMSEKPKTEPKAKKRLRNIPDPDKILKITYELMSIYGYSGTPISMICEKSGYPPASIYWHFGNKKSLLLAALEFGIKQTLGRMDVQNLKQDDYDAAILIADVDFFGEPPLIYRMMFLIGLENNGEDQELASIIHKVREYARTIMRAQIEFYALKKDKKLSLEIMESIADMVLIMADGIILSTQLEPGKINIAQITEMFNSTVQGLVDKYG